MRTAKVRSLSIRPIRSSDLSFSIGGILSRQTSAARLGQRVERFNDESLHDKLAELGSAGRELGRFLFDARAIDRLLAPLSLFLLRNERSGSELNQAIAAHQSEYLERYSSAGSISASLRAENSERLATLAKVSDKLRERHMALSAAYPAEKPIVQKAVKATSRHEGDSPPVTKTFSAPLLLSTAGYSITVKGGGMPAEMTHVVPDVNISPKIFKGGAFQAISEELGVNLGAAAPIVSGPLNQVSIVHQKPVVTETELPELGCPAIEEELEWLATMSEVGSEQYELIVRKPRLNNLEQIISNEDQALRIEVAKRQADFRESFLVSPFRGLVTAIYKDIGEYVQPGEPVLRVEDDDELLIVGIIQCKGIIELNEPIHLEAKNAFESGATLTISGRVVAVRGHDVDDDEWDVVIHTMNGEGQVLRDKQGKTKLVRLPLNLQLDKFETTVALG